MQVQTDVHLVRLLFCNKSDPQVQDPNDTVSQFQRFNVSQSPVKMDDTIDEIDSYYDICLPFQILIYYLKNAKHGMLTEIEMQLLNDSIV